MNIRTGAFLSPVMYRAALWCGLAASHVALMGIDACRETDEDDDGWSVEGGDCDDANRFINPGAPEVCDRLDNNCTGEADEGLDCTAPLIYTVAGTGVKGVSGDGGEATLAQLNGPAGVTVDFEGGLLIADHVNHRVRRVGTDGIISNVAGTGVKGFSGDGGPATQAQLFYPSTVRIDGLGNLYIADAGNDRIRKVDADGIITTVAGNGVEGYGGDGGPATEASLDSPFGVAVDGSSNVYIADTDNHRIRRVSAVDGTITTVAGSGVMGFGGDEGSALEALLDSPFDVEADAGGNLYIADLGNHRIRWVGLEGNIYTVAGSGTGGFGGDGLPATWALLSYPSGVTLDREGRIYIIDTQNHRVRVVDTDGIILTLAGTGEIGYSGDGGPAVFSSLNWPGGVAVDDSGRVYIGDSSNQRVRRVGE